MFEIKVNGKSMGAMSGCEYSYHMYKVVIAHHCKALDSGYRIELVMDGKVIDTTIIPEYDF